MLAGLAAVGATDAQAASGLLVTCVTMGVLSIVLSVAFKVPLKFAWSTPGAALLVATAGVTGRFGEAVAAFIVAALLIVLVGLWPALGRLIARIPRPIANAMLAGILFPLCLAPVQAAVQIPLLAIPVIVVWLVLSKLAPRWAVPAAIVLAGVLLAATVDSGWLTGANLLPNLAFVAPEFDPLVVVSIALPLFVVTMAGQNIPGFTVMKSNGYTVPPRFALVGTGLGSAGAAFFGGHAINLGAITAAIMAGDESHPDRSKRWTATLTNGLLYIPLGLGAGAAVALVNAAPSILITAVAGLAVLGALISSVVGALEAPEHRITAIITFLVVASGIVIAGIGSAFWGLLAGGIVMLWLGWQRRPKPEPISETAPYGGPGESAGAGSPAEPETTPKA